MSVINTVSRHARNASLELMIGAAIVLLAIVLLAAHRYRTETFDSSRDWNSASDELKVRVTESHLWLEEWLGGDRSVDLGRQVFANLDGARAQCRALVHGGRSDVGEIERLPRGEARAATATTCSEIVKLRAAAIGRPLAGDRSRRSSG